MANVLDKENVTVWIAPAGTVGADLAANGTKLGFIKSFGDSGFGQDSEQVDIFGGNLSAIKPNEMFEEEFEFLVYDGADRDLPDKIRMGEEDVGMVAFQKKISASEYQWIAFNNISSKTVETDFAADGNWEGTMTFKAPAFDELGNHNWDYGKEDIENAVTGLISGNQRTLANGLTRNNSW